MPRRTRIAAVTLVLAGNLMAARLHAEVSTESLLGEMVDLKRLMKLPDPPYTSKQFSSWDRKSQSPDDHEGWFANADTGQFIRTEEIDGRKEFVMMDTAGPGVIVRIWSADPGGTIRFYLDRGEKPVLEADFKRLLSGDYPHLPRPIAGERGRGWNLYFPITYATHCKVTIDKPRLYYHLNYRTYPAGTPTRTFSPADLQRLDSQIQEIAQRLSDTRKGGGPPADRVRKPFDFTLKPGEETTAWEMDGARAICGFLVHLKAPHIPAAARAVVVKMTFDGQQTVEAPIGDFYGTAPGLNPYSSLPLGITEGDNPDLWCHWWMPFARQAKVVFKNLGRQEVHINGAVATVPNTWDDRTLLFHAKWRIERDIPSRPFIDWNHLDAQGAGRLVGSHLHLINPVKTWWGEGDEKIYVDGETFPSTFGTGTEDYYGYAWGSPQVFSHAYHNQPRCDGPKVYGNTSINRFHVIDDIPFTSSIRFDMENWAWPENIRLTRAAITYWYARPGGKDTFKPITAADVEYIDVPPYRPMKVAGAIEGERMALESKTGGDLLAQEINDKFSGDTIMRWMPKGPGEEVVLRFESPVAGRKHLLVQFAKASDFGQVKLSVNGQPVGETIDLFSRSVEPTGEIDLGEVELKAGANLLSMKIVGANPATRNKFVVGLDYVRVRD